MSSICDQPAPSSPALPCPALPSSPPSPHTDHTDSNQVGKVSQLSQCAMTATISESWWMVMDYWNMSLKTFLSCSLIFTLTARILSHELI